MNYLPTLRCKCLCSVEMSQPWFSCLSQLALIESALRTHYGVRDSRDLGYGALHMLADRVQRQRSLPGGGSCPVYYEAALFSKHTQLR